MSAPALFLSDVAFLLARAILGSSPDATSAHEGVVVAQVVIRFIVASKWTEKRKGEDWNPFLAKAPASTLMPVVCTSSSRSAPLRGWPPYSGAK